MTIREAIPGDETTLAQLNRMVHDLHVSARPDVFASVSPGDLVSWFGAVLRKKDQRVWLAEIDGVPAGYLLAMVLERPATLSNLPRRWCEIDQLGVAEGMRRRGVARGLVEAAIDWAHGQGLERVSAQCWSFNSAAQATFARLGFTPMNIRLERGTSA